VLGGLAPAVDLYGDLSRLDGGDAYDPGLPERPPARDGEDLFKKR